jgi:hypothetical protein
VVYAKAVLTEKAAVGSWDRDSAVAEEKTGWAGKVSAWVLAVGFEPAFLKKSRENRTPGKTAEMSAEQRKRCGRV